MLREAYLVEDWSIDIEEGSNYPQYLLKGGLLFQRVAASNEYTLSGKRSVCKLVLNDRGNMSQFGILHYPDPSPDNLALAKIEDCPDVIYTKDGVFTRAPSQNGYCKDGKENYDYYLTNQGQLLYYATFNDYTSPFLD